MVDLSDPDITAALGRRARPARPWVTYLLIAAIAGVWIWTEWIGSTRNPYDLVRFGARFNPLIARGQWWRLFTQMFLHAGLVHVSVNSYSLYNVGWVTERVFGHLRTLFIFLTAGVGGALAGYWLGDPRQISVGASGAIFGLVGALFFWWAASNDPAARRVALRGVLPYAVVILALGAVVPGIDQYGHVGGLVTGFGAAALVGLPRGGWGLARATSLILAGGLLGWLSRLR